MATDTAVKTPEVAVASSTTIRISKLDEQKVAAAIMLNPGTIADVVARSKLTIDTCLLVLAGRVEKWQGTTERNSYGTFNKTVVDPADDSKTLMEFVPNDRWFKWAEKKGEILPGTYDLAAIKAEVARRAAPAPPVVEKPAETAEVKPSETEKVEVPVETKKTKK